MSEQGPIPGQEEPAEFNTPYAADVLAAALEVVLAEQVRADAGRDEDYMPEIPAADGIVTQEGPVEPVTADERTPCVEPTKKHSPVAYALALFAGRLANTMVNAIEDNGKSLNRRAPTE